MARFVLGIEYDGSEYKGWQLQKGVPTIQGTLFNVTQRIFDTKTFELYGAGRTDAGVHAICQMAHLDVETKLGTDKIVKKYNDLLPADINILFVRPVSKEFHARHDVKYRSYVYHISKRRSAFGKKYVWWVKEELDIEKMKIAAQQLSGFKDFVSFGQKEKDKDKSTLVEVKSVQIKETGNSILIQITGSHFLWSMVRRMVGVMVEAGKNKLTNEDIQRFFEGYSERPSQLTAPASGLYFKKAYYPGESVDSGINQIILI